MVNEIDASDKNGAGEGGEEDGGYGDVKQVAEGLSDRYSDDHYDDGFED